MELKGKRIIVLVETMYNEMEFWYPYYRLKEAGAEVVVVGSKSADEYASKAGIKVKADYSAAQIKASDFDGIIIPGGYAPDHMRRHPEMVQLVKDIYAGGKTVAAICHAGWMLASADIIKGKKLTSYFAIKDDVVNAGAEWLDQEVVIDGRLITSRTPDDLPAFMKAVINSFG
jgi:protease I